MRFALTDEQSELQSLVRQFFADQDALGESRAVTERRATYSSQTWSMMARDLGLQGVDLPDDLGGAGMSAVELVLTLEEAGGVLYPGPLAVTAVAAGALLEILRSQDSESARGLLADICTGTSVAIAGQSKTPFAAEVLPDGWVVTGEGAKVIQADAVDHLLVIAQASNGDPDAVLLAVDRRAASVEPLVGIDGSRNVCSVGLSKEPAVRIGLLDGQALGRLALRADLVTAAESLGAARRCLEMATGYAKVRVQFGQPVGSFQAVKHRLADLLVDVELATSLVYLAACHLAEGDGAAARESVPMALATAIRAATRAARDSVQVHGGIAFTWEHDAHLYTRRAAATAALLAGPRAQLLELYAITGRPAHVA